MDASVIRPLIEQFLAEDIAGGDITSAAIFTSEQPGEGILVAKDSFVVCGLVDVAGPVFSVQNPAVEIVEAVEDGGRAAAGDILMRVRGPVVDLLKAERVALNLVQRLCGIATLTAEFVKRVRPLPVRIVDTRKTTPGLRVFEKYAVRAGGGQNHRMNLSDGILIKDNHIAACGSIKTAVERVRAKKPHTLQIEVETADLQQVEECLAAGVDIIMLDNMEIATMRQAVQLVAGRALIEASGGVRLENVRAIAETGVDIISIGALTHSAPAVDISMRIVEGGRPRGQKK